MLNTEYILQHIVEVEVIKNSLYTIHFTDGSSMEVFRSEGNTYICNRRYVNINQISYNVGVYQINVIWYSVMSFMALSIVQKRA